jgi:hypothetical protein
VVGAVAGPETGEQVNNTLDAAVAPIVGSGGPLNNVLNPNDLFGGLNPTDLLGAGLGGGINDNTIAALVNTVVADTSQTVGNVAGAGSIDGILDSAGAGVGTIVDDVLGGVGNIANSGALGGLLDGIGGDIVSGGAGGGGLLAGTPLAGLAGDGALASANILRADDSSSSSSAQAGVGTDLTQSLLNVDAASERDTSESNHIVDTDVGPQTGGSGVQVDAAGAERDSSGALVDGDVGQHDGPSLVDANALTAADSFSIPSLDGAGLDSLVGEIGQPGSGPIGGDTNVLPLTVGVDGHALIDLGADGSVDAGDIQVVDSGTNIMINSPLHNQLVTGA